jgi:hypothetical protein
VLLVAVADSTRALASSHCRSTGGILNVNEALPVASVFAVTAPRNTSPSPLPELLATWLANSSIRKLWLGVHDNEPLTETPPSEVTVAPVRVGKFCTDVTHPGSVVTPAGERSIPRIEMP